MIVKWEQTQTEGGRRRQEGGGQGAKVITLSLVHCCLLSDLIWSRRHTWAKPHPSQVRRDPSITRSLLPSILPFWFFSVLLSHAYIFFSFKALLASRHLSKSVLNMISPHRTPSDSVQLPSLHPSSFHMIQNQCFFKGFFRYSCGSIFNYTEWLNSVKWHYRNSLIENYIRLNLWSKIYIWQHWPVYTVHRPIYSAVVHFDLQYMM